MAALWFLGPRDRALFGTGVDPAGPDRHADEFLGPRDRALFGTPRDLLHRLTCLVFLGPRDRALFGTNAAQAAGRTIDDIVSRPS